MIDRLRSHDAVVVSGVRGRAPGRGGSVVGRVRNARVRAETARERRSEAGRRRRAAAAGPEPGNPDRLPHGRRRDGGTDAVGISDSAPDRFPEGAGGSRVGAPHAHARSVEERHPSAHAVTARHRARGTTPPAPAPEPAKDSKDKKKNDKRDPKGAAAPAAPTYPYEDVALLELKPPAPGQPLRIQRGIGVPAGSYDLYVVMHERTAGGEASGRKQPRAGPHHARPAVEASRHRPAERLHTPAPP